MVCEPLSKEVHHVGERHIGQNQEKQYDVSHYQWFDISRRAEGNQILDVRSRGSKSMVNKSPGEESGEENGKDK